MKGRLGDLLHAKEGLSLGLSNDPWYAQTRTFLRDSAEYLSKMLPDSTPFFAFEGVADIEMVKVDQ